MSLFARGDFGDENITDVTGGLRIYLSDDPGRSLIDRHRRDDPKVYAPTFPVLAAGPTTPGAPKPTPQCSVDGFNKVTSPADGNCTCPGGPLTGQKPNLSGGGGYYCQNL